MDHRVVEQTKSSELTPEQLLKMLDLQLEQARQRRARPASGARWAVLAAGLVLIVAGCALALLILQQTLADLPAARSSRSALPSVESLR